MAATGNGKGVRSHIPGDPPFVIYRPANGEVWDRRRHQWDPDWRRASQFDTLTGANRSAGSILRHHAVKEVVVMPADELRRRKASAAATETPEAVAEQTPASAATAEGPLAEALDRFTTAAKQYAHAQSRVRECERELEEARLAVMRAAGQREVTETGRG